MTTLNSTSLRRFVLDEEGSSEVEFMLLTAFIVLPLTFALPTYLVTTFAHVFGRIGWWINLPIP